MRTIDYEILPPLGPGTEPKSGTLAQLVHDIPYLLMPGPIPPRAVLNSIFKTGLSDAGMSGGCRWQPFEISPAEYDELVRALVADSKGTLTVVDTPDWVRTQSDWTAWWMQHLHHVPADEHRRLTARYEELERERKDAEARGDSALAEDLFVQAVRAGTELGDFIMSHRKPKDRA
jgi:hypothetical protein